MTRTEKVGQVQKTLFDMPFSLKLEDVILQAQTGYVVEVKFIADTEASVSLGSTISGHAGGEFLEERAILYLSKISPYKTRGFSRSTG